MNLQHTVTAPAALRYTVCDPQGRPLQATRGDSPTQSQELFACQFGIPWLLAEEDGYEVFEVADAPFASSSLH